MGEEKSTASSIICAKGWRTGSGRSAPARLAGGRRPVLLSSITKLSRNADRPPLRCQKWLIPARTPWKPSHRQLQAHRLSQVVRAPASLQPCPHGARLPQRDRGGRQHGGLPHAHGGRQLTNVMFVVVCAVIGGWAIRRYVSLLMRAEQAANQASCPDCGDYGRFQVVGTGRGCRRSTCAAAVRARLDLLRVKKPRGAPGPFSRACIRRARRPRSFGVAHVLDQLLGLLVRRRREQADQQDDREAQRHAEHAGGDRLDAEPDVVGDRRGHAERRAARAGWWPCSRR